MKTGPEVLTSWMRLLTFITAALWAAALFTGLTSSLWLIVAGGFAGYLCYRLVATPEVPGWGRTIVGMMLISGVAGLGTDEVLRVRSEGGTALLPAFVGFAQTLWGAVMFLAAPVRTFLARRGYKAAVAHASEHVSPATATWAPATPSISQRSESAEVTTAYPGSPVAEPGVATPKTSDPAEPRQIIEAPSRPGALTGFEPAVLAHVDYDRAAFLYGEPQDQSLDLAKAMSRVGLLDRFATFWHVGADGEQSSAMPSDSLIVTGRSVHVVQPRREVQGSVVWSMENGKLIAVDEPTGALVGQPRTLANVERSKTVRKLSQDLKTRRVPLQVKPAIVLLPTDQGTGKVPVADWNDATGYSLTSFLEMLAAEPSFDYSTEWAQSLTRQLRSLVKQLS